MTATSRVFVLLVIVTVSVPSLSAAQTKRPATGTPAQTPSPVQAPPGQAPSSGQTSSAGRGSKADVPNADQLIEPLGFAYVPEGRRDPFISLLRRGSDSRAAASGTRPSGLGGLGAEEITLRGTVRSRDGFVGILQGADQKTYIVRAGDKLYDGTIRTITQNDLVIVQQVNDPLSLEKQREVRKVLRQIEAK
jgi:Tfp pilus assembly protein PilP